MVDSRRVAMQMLSSAQQQLWGLLAIAHRSIELGQHSRAIEIYDGLLSARSGSNHHYASKSLLPGKKGRLNDDNYDDDDDDDDNDEDNDEDDMRSVTISYSIAEIYRGLGTALALSGRLELAADALSRLLEVRCEDIVMCLL